MLIAGKCCLINCWLIMIKNTYSFWGYLRLAIFVVRTKFVSSKARIIRFPIEIRGKKFIYFGTRLTTGKGCRFEVFSTKEKKLFFGNDVQLNDYVHISVMSRIDIGDNVLMASHIYISDNSHGFYGGKKHSSPDIPPIKRDYKISSVFIGNNVWIGEGVVIMPGVRIGDGSVIGANSIVTKSIPANSIAVGQPAKVIKKFDDESQQWIVV